MRDFTPYGLIFGIIIILGLGILEQNYLECITKELFDDVKNVEETFLIGDLENSIVNLQNAINNWEKHEKVLDSMLNHEEVHKISEALIEINSKLKNFSNSSNVSSNFALLEEYIINMKEGNRFIMTNVL